MPRPLRLTLLAPLLLALAVGAGCASTDDLEYARQLDPLVGRAPVTYFVDRYGEPERRSIVDSRTEILVFRLDDRTYSTVGTKGSIAVTTRLRLTFKDGVLSACEAANAMK